MSTVKILIRMIFGILFALIFVGALLFIPAGSVDWLEGWIYLFHLVILIIFYYIYFIIKDPSTLEKRKNLSSVSKDKIFLLLIGGSIPSLLIIPGLDYHYHWSQLPFLIELIGYLGLLLSYVIIILVYTENPFASPGLTIHKDQEVIDTGPYGFVRHPIYLGLIIMFLCMPLVLGSLITLFISITSSFILILRISYEETMLLQVLNGYDEYMKKVRFRLIPRVW